MLLGIATKASQKKKRGGRNGSNMKAIHNVLKVHAQKEIPRNTDNGILLANDLAPFGIKISAEGNYHTQCIGKHQPRNKSNPVNRCTIDSQVALGNH